MQRLHTFFGFALSTLLLAGFTAACGSDPADSNPTSDAHGLDAQPFDAGVGAVDAGGQGGTDTGATSADTGTSAVEAGATPEDSGPADDTASAPTDTSQALEDGSASAPDAGSSAGDAGGSADAEDPGLTFVPVSAAGEVSAVVAEVGSQQATFVRPFGDSIVFSGSKGPHVWHPDIDVLAPIKGAKGKLIEAVQLGGTTLLATDVDLYAVVQGEAKPSPLGAALAGGKGPAKISVMLTTPGKSPDLWLLAGNKLHLYRAGKLHTVSVKGLDPTGAKLAFGPRIQGKPALWLAVGQRIAGVLVDNGKVQAWVEIDDRPAQAMRADAQGHLWVQSDGALIQRDHEGLWQGWKFPASLTDLMTGPALKEVFLRTKSGWWLHVDGGFHTLTQVPNVLAWAPDTARALIATSSKISRLQTTKPKPKPKTTWTKDVHPIYLNSCALCHSEKGVNTKLYEASQWQAKYDVLWKLVSSGGMPLAPKDPLTPAELAIIKKWKLDGFPQ